MKVSPGGVTVDVILVRSGETHVFPYVHTHTYIYIHNII